jgi:plasmid stability protein
MTYQLHHLKSEPRTKGILLNLTEAEHADLKAKCAEAGISVSAALRGIVKGILEAEEGFAEAETKEPATV